MKNWIVISKPVKQQFKGLSRYLAYLTSESHKNHIGNTTIIPIVGSAIQVQRNINNAVIQRDYERAKSRKGGRSISSYAQSFVLSLPKSIEPRPDIEVWKKISKELVRTISYYTTDNISDLKNNIFINLHDQDNPHLNIVVSKVIDGNVIKAIQQKSIVNALKKTFNFAILKHLGLSPSDYKPKTKRGKRYNTDFYMKHRSVINAIAENPAPQLDFKIQKSKSTKLRRRG